MWIAEIPADKLIYAIPLLLVPILPNLWAIAHIYRHDFPSSTEKMAWLVAQIILPVLGGIGYMLSGRKRARKP